MDTNSGLSASDILAITKDNGSMSGNNFWWIIIFLIVAGMFGGNGFFGGNNNNLNADEFIKRDIFGVNQNVSTTAANTQRDVLNSQYTIGTQALENRYAAQLGVQEIINNDNANFNTVNQNVFQAKYDNALGQAGLQKDMLLGNQTIQSQMAQNALSAQANQAQCCCDLKTTIHAEGEATRALITENTIQNLRDQVRGYELVAALGNQTNTLSSRFGTFLPNPPYYPYYSYGVSGVV